MKKKFFIGLFIFAAIGLFVFAHLALKHNNVEEPQTVQQNLRAPIEIPEGNIVSFEEAKKSDKPMIVMFYVDWCAYCRRFMPKFAEYSKEFNKDYTFTTINCDIPAYRTMVEDFHIMGFPTLYVIDKKLDFRYQLPSIVTIDKDIMTKELKKYSNLRNKALKN